MLQHLTPMRVPVGLRRLFPHASFVGCADIRVTEATEHSRLCSAGMLFAAVPGTRVDGTQFVSEAVERGASALLVQQPQAGVSVPQCVVPNVRRAYAELCTALAGSPWRRLGLVGVTGTNGKTTVTWLLRSILQAAGRQTGLLGTIEYSDGLHSEPSRLTTPDSKTLAQWLGAMVARRTTHAALEVSSHALDQDRCAGTQLDVGIVTNITQDHFDYHKNYDAYRASKARILELVKKGGLAVLNADDPGSLSLRNLTAGVGQAFQPDASAADRTNGEGLGVRLESLTYGLDSPADVTATIVRESLVGSRFVLNIGDESIEVCTSLVGRHNVSNCLAAAAAAARLGLPLDVIASGIESLACVPGRLERVDCGQPCDVFVDYAHTDDALRRCVRFLKSMSRGRVVCVFGAGGDRDRTKRPLLGQAAAEADLAVVTSDNPRSEPPEQIVRDILTGFPAGRRPYVVLDRAEAIRWALANAAPGDAVLIAGKGHETEQIIGTERHPFDDREVVREFLATQLQPTRRRAERLPV